MSTNKYLKDYLDGAADEYTTSFENFHTQPRSRRKFRVDDPSERKTTRQPKSRTRRTTKHEN